jgi:nitroreductase/dihydropteridine reductase
MGGFIPEAYDDVLGLKAQGLTASVVCALGKRHVADEVAAMPKVRVPYADMIIEL